MKSNPYVQVLKERLERLDAYSDRVRNLSGALHLCMSEIADLRAKFCVEDLGHFGEEVARDIESAESALQSVICSIGNTFCILSLRKRDVSSSIFRNEGGGA